MNKNGRLILLLAVARFVLPYLLQNGIYEPHRDEFLYLAEGQHLAWGYLEVPPLLSFFAWLTHLFGNSIFWIKFWPDLFGSLTFVICAKAVVHMGGKKLELWLLFFAFAFGAWLRMFFLFQPNAPEIYFSALMAYGLFRYQQTERNAYLYWFGIALGLGLLSKYTAAFWCVSLLAGLLLTKSRTIFINRHFYFSILIAFLIFVPNLVWQIAHQFPVLHHMAELKETQLQYIRPLQFLIDELLMYIPVFFVWIAGLYFCLAKEMIFRFFGLAFFVLQILMIIFHGKGYYTAGAFTILFAFGAVHLGRLAAHSKILKYAIIAFPVLTGVLLWPLLLPVFKPAKLADFYKSIHIDNSSLLNWEDLKSHPLPQDFADMLGWEEMADGVAKAYAMLSLSEKENLIIWCDNYGQAGAVNYYRKRLRYPEAYSSNGSFLFWLPSSEFPENVILVTESTMPMEDMKIRQFESIEIVDSVRNPFSREHGSTILILKRPSRQLRAALKKEIEEKRKIFMR